MTDHVRPSDSPQRPRSSLFTMGDAYTWMRRGTLLVLLLALLVLAGCQRGCSRFSRMAQVSERTYVIEQYSGGKLIKKHTFTGILNNQEGSDGYYWYDEEGHLHEVSGDFHIESWR